MISLVLFLLSFSNILSQSHAGEWRYYGNDPGGMRYSTLAQINMENVSKLRPVWTYRTGEVELMQGVKMGRPAAFECTPLMANRTLFLSTPSGRLMALRPETGQEIWSFDPQGKAGKKRQFAAHRGVAYWQADPASTVTLRKRIFSGTAEGKLYCLDAETGSLCPDFGENGSINLRKGFTEEWEPTEYSVTSPPTVYKNVVIVGSSVPEGPSEGPSGDVRAFNAENGDQVWRFHTIPRPGEPGHDTWTNQSWSKRTGANVWSIMSLDEERGLVFLPTGSPAYDFYGADRKGKNLFGNSVVALDALSGKLIWHFQAVHHDIWDYDLPAQPTLVTVRHNGQDIPAVAQVTKMGFVFVLNRLTGEPLFPLEERPVPASEVPKEKTWATQPFPLKPPPLSRYQPLRRDELADLTPEHKASCEALYDSAEKGGVYMPAGLGLTLSFPGTLGGATWSGSSFDPSSGLLYVNTNEVGRIARMEESSDGSFKRNSPWGAYARFWDEHQWPCQKPPWGKLHAIDLNTGRIAWTVTLGGIRELEKLGIVNTGAPNLGGSIVTKGGLVFIAGTNDRRFRAFAAIDGKELWTTDLEASGHATPMTYLGSDGKQYVVIAAGGGGTFSEDRTSDTLIAFALP